MRSLPSRKLLTALAAATIVLAGAGVASAAWMSTGAGSASARASSAVNSSIAAATLEVADDLYPAAVKSTKVTITNPNPYPVVVTSISAGSSAATSAGACGAGTVTSDAQNTGSPLAQAGGATSIAAGGTGTYVLTVRMAANPDNSCQADAFTLPLTATLQSAA